MSGIPPLANSIGVADVSDVGVYIIDIPDWIPTRLNCLMGVHWGTAAKRKKADTQMVWAYARAASIPHAIGKRSVGLTITLAPKQRAGDPDSYFKVTLDALVHCKLLTDDNRQGVVLLPVEFKRAERKATRIVLREAA